MKTKLTPFRVFLIVGACAALDGCLSSTPHWDQTFGESIKQVTAMQTLNPRASDNDDPVAGIDGAAADAAQGRYAKSFLTPPPPVNVFTIGVGAGGSGGSGGSHGSN